MMKMYTNETGINLTIKLM